MPIDTIIIHPPEIGVIHENVPASAEEDKSSGWQRAEKVNGFNWELVLSRPLSNELMNELPVKVKFIGIAEFLVYKIDVVLLQTAFSDIGAGDRIQLNGIQFKMNVTDGLRSGQRAHKAHPVGSARALTSECDQGQ
jgi:hypothetical protein